MLPSGTWWRTCEPGVVVSIQMIEKGREAQDGDCELAFLMVEPGEEDCFYCARRHSAGSNIRRAQSRSTQGKKNV
jgi:hypothetical protein